MAHACYICNYEPVPDGEGVECPHCHRLQYGKMCPHCGQNAPTIVRGMKVVCSACNNVRGPLAGAMPLNIVGQPQRIGSAVTKFAGWGIIVVAMLFATLVGLIGSWAVSGAAGLLAALMVGGIGVAVGALTLAGSRKLREQGTAAQTNARESAIYALAANRGGQLTATDVAAALNITAGEADALLTQMAREAQRVSVEVDGSGVVHYVFKEVRGLGQAPVRNVRVEPAAAPAQQQQGTGVRVEPTLVAGPGAAQPQSPAEVARTKVDQEWEQMQARHRAGPR